MIDFNNKRNANASLKTPILITVSVVLFVALFLGTAKHYKMKTLNMAYENNIIRLQDAITAMDAVGTDYFHSPVFSEKELKDYDLRPGKFLRETVGVSKYCGNSNGDCFAKKYKYENGQPYTPIFKGACAILKNGPSICMIPQIKKKNIKGIIDVTGPDGPNVYGKDLRTFEIKAKIRNYDPDEDDKTSDVRYTYY
jgi:hypothetical protein